MMKTVFFALILAAGTAVSAADALINNNLDQPDSIRQWAQIPGMTYQSQGGVNDSGCLKFSYTEGADNRKISELVVPIDQVRGRGVTLSAMLKGDNIAKPQLSYLGPALALKIVSPSGTMYAGHTKQYGSYDWRQATAFCNIPKDATMVSIIIGLQQSGGTLYVDNLRLDVMPDPDQIKFNPAIQLQNPKINAFRGVMIGHDLSEDAFRELGEVWNTNIIRFWIDKDKINDHNTEQGFRTIVQNRLKVLDEILPYLRKYNINVIIDMHVGPGAKVTELSSNDLSWDPKMQDLLADVWREIAARYKDEPAVWGYDLLNEPREDNFVYKPGGGLDWNGLADKISRAIREVDPDTPIIVECAQWGHPAGFETLRPVSVNNVIYSFHYYQPHSYTHQGIHGRPDNIVYPGMIDGKLWNREQMVQSMKPVIDFQKKYNVPIYVGEFSVALWAPGSEQYLEDCISIFEEHGWSWTYHSFREYHGWDAEMTGPLGQGKRVGDTPRRRILLKYMKNNVRELKQLEPVKKETTPAAAVRQEELKSQLDTPGKTPPPPNGKSANELRVLFIGDSITLHGANDDTKAKLKWSIVAGMAASAPDKDYVSLFAAVLKQRYPQKEIKIIYHTAGGGGSAAQRLAAVKPYLKMAPDLVVVQLGEHEKETTGIEEFRANYRKLLESFANQSPRPVILAAGVWNPAAKGRIDHYINWPRTLDDTMKQECQRLQIPFAPVEKYALDPNCSGSGGSPGVQWHPNDAGMQGYADALTAALQQAETSR